LGYNPIFLWGEAGSGKTHLLMALAHAFKERGLNALYVRAETFTDHVVSAIRASEMHAFRKAYRHADILLVDDVHVFARKNATQEEFFHTFNTLHASGRQLILSSQCKPGLLEEIEPRLVSRFEWGITLQLKKLVGKELKSILERRSEEFNFPLSEEVAAFLVQTFASSQSLNKALEALILRCHMQQEVKYRRNPQSIDLGSAKQMLADLIAEEFSGLLTPEKIVASVATFYGMRSEDLLGKSQAQESSLPRQIAMYLCREQLKLPFQKIGHIFSRDHSTVMTSVKQVEKKVEGADREMIVSLSEIRKVL
jgi:chromosomal replication initiator protein